MTPLRPRPVTSRHNVARLEEVGIDPDTHAHVMLGVDAVSADTVPGTLESLKPNTWGVNIVEPQEINVNWCKLYLQILEWCLLMNSFEVKSDYTKPAILITESHNVAVFCS